MFAFFCYYICPVCGEGHTAMFWFRSEDEMFAWWESVAGTLLSVRGSEDLTWLDPDGTMNGYVVAVNHA